jgi:TolB-like protein
MSFVSELRRREVFRTAAWYGGLAWLAIEIANTVFPQFGLPGWSVRAVIVAALLGLPVVLALAWWFDLSRTGLRRESPSVAEPARHQAPAGLTVSAQQAWQRLVRPSFEERPGIAVLPFANLSPDPANAYFADGLHEEILATFARTSGLRVVSRTSVQEYRDAKRNLREIAEALDVALILEGSVRREGDDLRLTLQLVDGRTDEPLWAETYDRKFRDALNLQRTVAESVVAAIGAKLSPGERQLIDQAAPTSPEAYDRYLHALALDRGNWSSPEELRLAESLLTEAIALDPGFALAYAMRANNVLWQVAATGGSPEQHAGIRADIERALELRPDLPDALAARGLYATYVNVDPERALADLERALELAPNDALAQKAIAFTLRRLGRFDDAIAHFDQAAALTPGQLEPRLEVASMLLRLGRHEDADRALRALIERDPARPGPRFMLRANRFLATGETLGWREEFLRLEPMFGDFRDAAGWWLFLLTCTQDLPGQIELLERMRAENLDPAYSGQSTPILLAAVQLMSGQPEAARPQLLTAVAAVPDIAKHMESLELADAAIALALLGRKNEALRAADAAVRLRPEARDAINGTNAAMSRAWVLIHTGDRADEGYAELQRLVGRIDQQPRWLAVTPIWQLLGDDGRAMQIIRSRFPAK